MLFMTRQVNRLLYRNVLKETFAYAAKTPPPLTNQLSDSGLASTLLYMEYQYQLVSWMRILWPKQPFHTYLM